MSGVRTALDVDALAVNAGALEGVADLRRDAWGHGLARVAPVLAASGITAAVFDDGVRVDGLSAAATPTIDGRALFGLPSAPVLRAWGTVQALKTLRAGEGVSYGHTHRATVDTTVALVTGGYGDGIVRALGNRVSVEVGGRLAPIVGRVAMDVCVVDVGDAAASPGDEVVFFGGDGPARDALATWEQATGLTAAELVCTVGLRS